MDLKKTGHTLNFLFMAADRFPPFRNDVVVLFAHEILSRGHKIDWLLQSEEAIDKASQVSWYDSTVRVGAASSGESKFARIRRNLQGFRNDLRAFKLAKENSYDFIQVKDKFIAGMIGLLAAKRSRTKFVYWLSYPFPEAQIYRARTGTAVFPLLYLLRGYAFKFILYRIILRFSDHIFVQSEQMKRDVMNEGIPEGKLTAISMGVSPEILDNELCHSPEASPGNSEKIVLYLGTLLKVRRMDFVIRLFVKVLDEVPDAILYMVGGSTEPEDLETLKKLAVDLGVEDKVVFTGNLPQEDALKYVQRAHVCLSPFLPTPIFNSTSPTKLVEYMAMGKAVVANDHPEQRLVLTESGAGICVPYEETAFADAIVRLLKDLDATVEMGIKGREYVKQYRNYKYLADLVENEYLDMCNC